MKTETVLQRNRRVDADKAWEVSYTRRGAIAMLTYFVIVVFLYAIGIANPWVHALVPVVGFILSTLAIAPLKRWWLRAAYKG